MNWLAFRLAYFRGDEALQKKEWKSAESFLRKALEIRPSSLEAAFLLAEALWNLQKTKEAREIVERLLKNHPFMGDLYLLLGTFLKKEGNLSEAQQHFEKSAFLNPKNAESWYELGKVSLEIQDWGKALHAFRHAVSINPFLLQERLFDLEETLKQKGSF